jgi:hypothetical protein
VDLPASIFYDLQAGIWHKGLKSGMHITTGSIKKNSLKKRPILLKKQHITFTIKYSQ